MCIIQGFPSNDDDLSSDNVWDYKPWWCQPQTIILTGALAVLFTYSIFGVWLSGPVVAFVGLWWYTFLVEYPLQFKEYFEEMARKREGDLPSIDADIMRE